MNSFLLFKSSEYSWLYTDKHLKGLHGNIGVSISDNCLSPEIVSDISNFGSVYLNWNSHNIKDYDKNSSDPRLVLEKLKLTNNHRLLIGNLNINSTSNKFDNLKLIIQDKTNILVITETKTDSTFPLNQFAIQGYLKPYRFDRNKNGGGVYIYVWEDIPSRELKIHNAPEDIENVFIKINLIKTKWLFCGSYHPPSQSDKYFFENIGKMLDKYSKHNKFMLVGDFNHEESVPSLSPLFHEYNTKNIVVKENTCFENALNLSDLLITNSPLSFQNTIAVSNGLSNFHKMVITAIKMSFKKHSPIEWDHRDYKYFDRTKFKSNLNKKSSEGIPNNESFETTFTEGLNKHAPLRNFLELIMLHTLQKPWGKW